MAERFKLAFTDPEELEDQIEEYFQSRVAKRKIFPKDGPPFEEEYQIPPTMAGLARHLGVVRQTLWRMGNRGDPDDPMQLVIARALNRLAEFSEEALFTREGNQGARFSLEVNHRYGREDEAATGGAFIQKITPPADSEAQLAIPKWGGSDE